MHYKRVSSLLRAKSHRAECKSRNHWSRLDEILIKVAKNTYLVMKETPVPPDVSMKPEKVGSTKTGGRASSINSKSFAARVHGRMLEVFFCLMRILSLKMDSHKKVRLLQDDPTPSMVVPPLSRNHS